MELLSPAGSFDALCAALSSGADAVYFGGNSFNARLGAENFDDDTIIRAFSLCHSQGKKAFVTMNTLTHDRDMSSAVKYASFLYENGADALIVQDVGLFCLLKKYLPDFELHASTQMCVSTLSGVRECEKMGFDRVVLSREVSLSDIDYIHSESDMPLEVFVHGAMCMSFSGACLFSSMVGGRSGNCGTCAQPCRKYAAVDHIPSKNELALSMADMCMIEHIKDLEKAGAVSLKIEGRMKKPEYVAAVTHAYRRAIDGADRDELQSLKKELFEIFNRGEFTTGYYFGDNAKCDRIAKSAPSDTLLSKINGIISNGMKKIPLDMKLTAKAGNKATLTARTMEFSVTAESDDVVQTPKNPITEQTVLRIKSQLEKLGGTYFSAGETVVDTDGFLPISSINELRRIAVSKAEEKMQIHHSLPKIPEEFDVKCEKHDNERRIICHVNDVKQAVSAFSCGADEVYLEYGNFSKGDIASLQKYRNKQKLGIVLPVTLLPHAAQENLVNRISTDDFDVIEINNIGQTEFAKQFPEITGGLHLNVFNAHTAEYFLSRGLDTVMLSPELTPPQMKEIQKSIPNENMALYVYGRIPLMNLFHCPVKEHLSCNECSKRHTLYDADGRAFPLFGTKEMSPCNCVKLYNCNAHDITGLIYKQTALPYALYLNFTDEDEQTIADRINAARYGGYPLANTTRGYWKK